MVNHDGLAEVIKVVLVGDSGVGKTCLACAHACGVRYPLARLVKTHVATVWATDHYQHDREVLEKSLCEVDGCPVSVRLWDTFGYHDKDRRFAYRGADVVVLCFSVMSPASLRNILRVWHPEVRKWSPSTPLVLCGTQTDLRYLCGDQAYLAMEKGLLYRTPAPSDVITPSQARDVARDLGAPYYETSVLTHYGVQDLFSNAARVALLERRKIKFWNASLRQIQRPLIQAPMSMPSPYAPPVTTPPTCLTSDLSALLHNKSECDVTFQVGMAQITAHRICLVVASTFFLDLFSLQSLASVPARRRPNLHLRKLFPLRFSPSDTDHLVDSDLDTLSTDTDFSDTASRPNSRFPLNIPYDHRAVEAIEIRFEEDMVDPNHRTLQTYVRMHDSISAASFRVVLEYLYTGTFRPGISTLGDLRRTAELLQLGDLMVVVDNISNQQNFLNLEMDKQFHKTRIKNLRHLALNKAFLSDITFEVDDGLVSAHKALLMGRCEMMYAMFSSDFLEAATDVIPFPGIDVETFRSLQEYLYTGELPPLSSRLDYLPVIELANRLCLPRLVTVCEAELTSELGRVMFKDCEGVLDDALTLLQPAELYNAAQLYQFCVHLLSTHYHELIQTHTLQFKALPPEKQELIEGKRWPPVWYLKELERYERQTTAHHLGSRAITQDYGTSCGCLCLRRRRRHRLRDPVELPM